ncbi:hypothetical protein NMY22_g2825 [Coprinellus aureogranulatus]|nr:hypothetical protein NMY22_g2825 [Coprinellus aureogranulatus]
MLTYQVPQCLVFPRIAEPSALSPPDGFRDAPTEIDTRYRGDWFLSGPSPGPDRTIVIIPADIPDARRDSGFSGWRLNKNFRWEGSRSSTRSELLFPIPQIRSTAHLGKLVPMFPRLLRPPSPRHAQEALNGLDSWSSHTIEKQLITSVNLHPRCRDSANILKPLPPFYLSFGRIVPPLEAGDLMREQLNTSCRTRLVSGQAVPPPPSCHSTSSKNAPKSGHEVHAGTYIAFHSRSDQTVLSLRLPDSDKYSFFEQRVGRIENSDLDVLICWAAHLSSFHFFAIVLHITHRMEIDLERLVCRLLRDDSSPRQMENAAERMRTNSAIQHLDRLSRRTSFKAKDVATVLSSLKALPSLHGLLGGVAECLDDLEAALLSLKSLRTILRTVSSLRDLPPIITFTRQALLEHWNKIVGWCSFLVRHVTPCLGKTVAQLLAFLVGFLIQDSVSFERSLLPIHNTVNLVFDLWTSEDFGGGVIFLEDATDQVDTDDICPILHVTALCLEHETARTCFLNRVRSEGAAAFVFKGLMDRLKCINVGPIGAGFIHPTRRIRVLSKLASVGLKLIADKQLNFEQLVSEYRLFYWLTFLVKAFNKQALLRLRCNVNDCRSVPIYSSVIMCEVIDGVVHMSFPYRLKNLGYIVAAGAMQICLSVFTPCIPWQSKRERDEFRTDALAMVAVISVHSPYRTVGFDISRALNEDFFLERRETIRTHSEGGKAFVEFSAELHYRQMVSEEPLSKRSQICSSIGDIDSKTPLSSAQVAAAWSIAPKHAKGTIGIDYTGASVKDCRKVNVVSRSLAIIPPTPKLMSTLRSPRHPLGLGKASRMDSGYIPLRHGLEVATYLEAIVAREYRSRSSASVFPTGIFDASLIELPLKTDMVQREVFLDKYASSTHHFHGRSRGRVEAYILDSSTNPDQIKLAHLTCSYGKDYLSALANLYYVVIRDGRRQFILVPNSRPTSPACPSLRRYIWIFDNKRSWSTKAAGKPGGARLMSSGSAFVVINHPKWAHEPTSAMAGIYSRLSQVPPITPSGPPLPIVVQCMPADVLDLEPVAQIVERLSGQERTPAQAWEGFVKDVVAELEAADLSVLPHIDVFFGIIQSRTANKYIALEWSDSDDSGAIYHIFSTFIGAFIYVLAGGNDNLKKWGLKRYLGVERLKKLPASRSEGPVPVLLSDFLKSVKGLGRKGKEKAKDEFSIGTVTVPDSSCAGPSTRLEVDAPPRNEEQQDVTSRLEPQNLQAEEDPHVQLEEASPLAVQMDSEAIRVEMNASPLGGEASDDRPAALPTISRDKSVVDVPLDHIVPIEYLQNLPEDLRFAPFMHRRKAYGVQVVHADKARLTQVNGPFQLSRNHHILPSFVLFYLRSHGWSDRVIEVVAIAYTCEATLTGFLTALSRENMPMSEASFLWYALNLQSM